MVFNKRVMKLVSTVLAVSLTIEPIVIAKQRERVSLYDSVKQFATLSGFNKKGLTTSQWYAKNNNVLDPENSMRLGFYSKLNPKLKLGTVEIKKGKVTEEKEVVHVKVTQGQKTFKYDIVREPNKLYLQDKVAKYTLSDMYYSNIPDQVLGQQNNPVMSVHKIYALSKDFPKTTAKYLESYRNFVLALENNWDTFHPNKADQSKPVPTKKNKYSLFLDYMNRVANAADNVMVAYDDENSCVVAGWIGSRSSGSCKPLNTDYVDTLTSQSCSNFKTTSDTGKAIACPSYLFGSGSCAETVPPENTTSKDCASNKSAEEVLKENQGKKDLIYPYLVNGNTEKIFDYDTFITHEASNVMQACFKSEYSQNLYADFLKNTERLTNLTESDFKSQFPPKMKSSTNSCPSSDDQDCNLHHRKACAATLKRIGELMEAKKKIDSQASSVANATQTPGQTGQQGQQQGQVPAAGQTPAVDSKIDAEKDRLAQKGKECEDSFFCTTDWWKMALGAVGFTALGVGIGYLAFADDDDKKVTKIVKNKNIYNHFHIHEFPPTCIGANEEACSFRTPGTGGLGGTTTPASTTSGGGNQ